mgnify:CR=1 FL=1
MAAQRGGRRRAPRPDLFRDALAAALADALDVDPSALAVSVTLDGDAVSADRLPVTLTLDAPSADTDDEQDTPDTTAGSDTPDGDAPTSRSGRDSAPDARAEEGSGLSAEDIDEEAEAAADLLEGLLDAMDLPGDLRINVQDAHAEVEVVGLEEGVLIGRRGQTLEAVQELVRTAMQRRFERRSRVLVDVDGYRARRMEKLLERADEAVAEVLDGGEPQRLEPMDPIERRLVHQRVAETAGVVSTSHGREPARRIVIELADD